MSVLGTPDNGPRPGVTRSLTTVTGRRPGALPEVPLTEGKGKTPEVALGPESEDRSDLECFSLGESYLYKLLSFGYHVTIKVLKTPIFQDPSFR